MAEEQTKQSTEGWSRPVEYEPKWWSYPHHYHRMTMTPAEIPVAQIQLLEQGASAPMSLQGREERGWVSEKAMTARIVRVTEARPNLQQNAHAKMMG